MRLKKSSKELHKNVEAVKKQSKNFLVVAEKGFEKYFLQRIGRLEAVGRFVSGWLILMGLLIGGLITQNILLSGYYQTVQAIPGGIYKEGMIGTFTNANPVYAVTEADSAVSRLVFAGLFNYDTDGTIVGDLAQDYTIDSHGTTYTVKLRPNLKWHDGQPLTSKDVVYTYHTIQNPDVNSPLKSSWQGVEVTAPNPSTVVFKLPTPLASFIYNLTTGIIPEHMLKGVPAAELRSSDFNTIHPVGAGPFSWRAIEVTGTELKNTEQQIALEAFEDYHAGPPKLDEVVFHTYADKDKMIKDFKNKELTAISGLNEKPKQFGDDENIFQREFLLRAATMVFFKTTSGILSDQKVRASLVAAADTDSIRKSLGYDTHAVREPLLPGQVAFDPKLAQKQNVNAAKAVLKADGWVKGKDGILVKNKVRLAFTLTAEDTPEYRKVSTLLKEQWRRVGVDMKVNLQSPTDLQLTLSSHNYEALLYGISIGIDPDVFVYWDSTQADIRASHRLNLSEYKSAVADTALESGRSRTDAKLRAIKYKPFLKAWQEDSPALGLYQPRYLYFTNGPVDGLDNGSLTTPIDRFINVNNWQIRQAKVTNY